MHNHRRERWDWVRNGFGDGETELQGHLRRPGWEEDGTRFDENAGRHINVIIIIIIIIIIVVVVIIIIPVTAITKYKLYSEILQLLVIHGTLIYFRMQWVDIHSSSSLQSQY